MRVFIGKIFSKNLNIILIILIIIAVILGLSFFLPRLFDSGLSRQKQQNFLSRQFDPLSDKDKYAYQEQLAKVIAKRDFAGCGRITDALYKTVCVNNIALKLAEETKDISYCQRIDGKLIPVQECEREIIFSQSIEKEDAEICGQTKDQELERRCRDNFYLQLSIKKNDITVCGQAVQDQQEFCHDNFLVTTQNFSGNF